jgi:cupin fold WbuC family metalloprotein
MPDARVQLLDSTLFRSLIERARQSPRLRTNHNFHSSMEDNPHRFLNVMVRGTYIAPHRHHDPPKSESFLVLEGELAYRQHPRPGARHTRSRCSAWRLAHDCRLDRARSLFRGEARTLLGGK